MDTHSTRVPGGEIPGRPLVGGARALAALALLAAGGIHGAQALRHLADDLSHAGLHTAFFVAAAVFQIVAGLVLVARSDRNTASAIAVASLGVAAIWVVAVTVGLPAILTGTEEPVTVAGTVASALAVLVACLLSAAPAGSRPASAARRRTQIRVAPLLAAGGVALVGSASLVPVSAGAHGHSAAADHSPGGAGAHQGRPGHHSLNVEGVHLHGLGGDAFDPGPDAARQARGVLAGTKVRAGLRPAAIAAANGVIWVADREAGVVHRLDAANGRSLGAPTRVGVHPSGVSVGAGSVWVTNAGSDSVSRLDAATGDNVGTIAVGSVPVGVATGAGYVWVANSAEGTVSRIEPATGTVTTTARIGYGPTAVTVAEGRLWVVASLDRAVVSLDPQTGAVVSETPVDAGPASIVFGHGSLWVASSSAGTVTRIDPVTGNRIGEPVVVDRRAQPGQGPAALAIGDRVWVLNNHDKTVVGIDPSTHAVSRPSFIDRQVARNITPASLAMSDRAELWATDHDSGLLVRIQTRREI